jgi:hypothetical protein
VWGPLVCLSIKKLINHYLSRASFFIISDKSVSLCFTGNAAVTLQLLLAHQNWYEAIRLLLLRPPHRAPSRFHFDLMISERSIRVEDDLTEKTIRMTSTNFFSLSPEKLFIVSCSVGIGQDNNACSKQDLLPTPRASEKLFFSNSIGGKSDARLFRPIFDVSSLRANYSLSSGSD